MIDSDYTAMKEEGKKDMMLEEKVLGLILGVVALAEVVTAFADFGWGIMFHMCIIIMLFGLYFWWSHRRYQNQDLMKRQKETKGFNLTNAQAIASEMERERRFEMLLLALMLAPMIRILSLVMPLYQFPMLDWFVIISIPIYIMYLIYMWRFKLNFKEYGIRLPEKQYLWLEIMIIAIAPLFGFIEYSVLHPQLIIPVVNIETLIIAMLILFIGTGLMEEVVFRGLLQGLAVSVVGPAAAIVFISILFGALHIGNVVLGDWVTLLDLVLVSLIGLTYGIVVLRTKSIIGVSISHMIVNTFLFIFAPLIFGA